MKLVNMFSKALNMLSKVITKRYVMIVKREECRKQITNIFDYNDAIKYRLSPYDSEVNYGLNMYGLGYLLREYSGYEGKIYCQIEHGITTLRTDNYNEYKDFSGMFAFTCSPKRASMLNKLSDKIVIPIGPYFMPYCNSVYDDYTITRIKENLGKTLVVFPLHNNSDNSYNDGQKKRKELIDYVENLKEQKGFNTVIVCMYYVDIINQSYLEYEKLRWKVVSAGQNLNYDFSMRLKTIIQLADLVVSQGSYSTICYATWLNTPSVYLQGSSTIRYKNGLELNIGKEWNLDEIYDRFLCLFGNYSESCSQEQINWCNEVSGFDSVKSPEQIFLLLELASKVKKCDSIAKIRKVLGRSRYLPIRDIVMNELRDK